LTESSGRQGTDMKMVMVGGHTRNIGKTSVVEGIIRATPEMNWTAVKITQFGHGVCSVDGEACECAVTEHRFSISEERKVDSGTDTARFFAAGARRSLWVRTRQGELIAALESLKKEIEADEFVIVESNSLRRFLKPTLYLQVVDPLNDDFKPSARQFFDLADAYLLVTRPGAHKSCGMGGEQAALLAREVKKEKPCFNISAEEHFMTRALIDFIRAGLVRSTASVLERRAS
jgi:molybdopterin-guanine dinucleotide biosynthesis protein